MLSTNHNNDIYANNVLIPVCVLLSGNNYYKFLLFANFLNLAVQDRTTFCRSQNFHCFPIIDEFWSTMKNNVSQIINDYDYLVACGDGRNDFCSYFIMEQFSNILLDLEVVDVRETSNSVNMERLAFTRLMQRLGQTSSLPEIVTDASPLIMKRFRELRMSEAGLQKTMHSLDVWHCAKSILKNLHKKANSKGNECLKEWIDGIINHFWYSCAQSNGNAEKLKECWFGVVHHVCGEHEWGLSSCNHGPLVESEPKTYLKKGGEAAEALRQVVHDKKLVQKLSHYTTFRHTSDLEAFNSMQLKYVPKRTAFQYLGFTCRTMLAAIDHNIHSFRSPACTKDGRQIFKRKYSKRTKKWHAEVVKTPKDYFHIPFLIAKILKHRKEDKKPATRHFNILERDPKRTILLLLLDGLPQVQHFW